MLWRAPLFVAILVSGALLSPNVFADTATAEALFREGRRLMDEGNFRDGCPKLAESYRIDPGTGALLALALCYERAGKLASAWGTYKDAALRAKREKRADREKAAREHAAALEPKLSKITIEVPDEAAETPGLVIKKDGENVDESAWGTAIPVDPGDHVLVVSAEGYRSFSQTVHVGANADRVRVSVPELQKLRKGEQPSEPSSAAASHGTSPVRIAGIVTGAVGLVTLAVGTYYGLRAKKKNDESDVDCDGDVCGPLGKSLRNSARRAGNVATVAFIGGGVLLATGITLYVVGAPNKSGSGLALSVGGHF